MEKLVVCGSPDLGIYYYNWCRPYSAVRTKHDNRVTRRWRRGLVDRPGSLEQMVALSDERTPKPRRPATYRKQRRATGECCNFR